MDQTSTQMASCTHTFMRDSKNNLAHSTNHSTDKHEHTLAAILMTHEVRVISPVLHPSSVAPDVADGCVCGVAGPHVRPKSQARH